MLNVIKEQLLKIIENIDAGNSNISEEDAINTLKYIRELTDQDKRLSKYQACQYLNISRSSFDNYVREGKLPKGNKQVEFKELSWDKKSLDKFIEKSRNGYK